MTGTWEYWWAIDDITIQQPEGSAPDVCTNMAPTDQATDVEITLSTTNTKLINFSWDAATTGDAATSYNVSIGTTNELEIGTLQDLMVPLMEGEIFPMAMRLIRVGKQTPPTTGKLQV